MPKKNPRPVRLVAWPGVPIKPAAFTRSGSDFRLDPTGRLLAPEDAPGHDEAWAGQIYLELFVLDLDEPTAIIDFVNRFGTFMVYESWDSLFAGISPYVQADAKERVLAARAEVLGASEAQGWLADRIPPGMSEDPFWGYCETVDEFQFGARLIRDLTRAWILLSDPASSYQPDWELPPSQFVESWIDTRVRLAELLLADGLTHILRSLHPRITLDQRFESGAVPGLVATPRLQQLGDVGLGFICALELYNQMLLGTAYKHCRFEGCDRPFIFQEERRHSGRPAAAHYKSRRDSLFCSPECRRAQGQRDHRRRRKQVASP